MSGCLSSVDFCTNTCYNKKLKKEMYIPQHSFGEIECIFYKAPTKYKVTFNIMGLRFLKLRLRSLMNSFKKEDARCKITA